MLDIKETLEELLSLVGAHVVSIDNKEMVISSHNMLPQQVHNLTTRISITMTSLDFTVIGKTTPLQTQSLRADYLYTFEATQFNIIKGLLWLASEKQRYEAFSKEIDKEIIEELNSKEE